MKNLIRGQIGMLVGAACVSATMTVSAATIFDNTTTFQNSYYSAGNEFGDQVYFATGNPLSNYRMLTQFGFQYWSFSSDANWNVEARVQFYDNTGPLYNGLYPSPAASSFFDSGWLSLPRFNAYQTWNFSASGGDFPAIGLQLPAESMTWTIQFRNGDANDQYGLALFTNPTVGTDPGDYWQYVAGSWQLATNSLVSDMSFGSYVFANIPEPSSVTLSVLGGLGLLAWTRRMRNQK